MQVYDAIQSRRTIRKFMQKEIPYDTLVKLVDCARLAPYGANLQPLKFAIINEEPTLSGVFSHTKWAGYLPDGTPKEHERPTAFIAILGDTNIKTNFDTDVGIAGTTITLAALDAGLASCWIASVNREAVASILKLPEHLSLLHVIALGYPAEESRAVTMENDVKYFYTDDGVLNVPKRSLDEVLIK